MARDKRRRLPAPERKRLILEAALPLFAQHGFHGVSTRELARAAGISEALLFKYFPSKLKLQREIYRHCARRFELSDERLAALAREPSVESLVKVIYATLRLALLPATPEARAAHRLSGYSVLDDGIFARILLRNATMRRCERTAVVCIEAGIAAGHIAAEGPPPLNRFWFARNVAAGAYSHRLPPDPVLAYDADPAKIVRQTLIFGLRGIGLKETAIRTFAAPARLREWERTGALPLTPLAD